MEFPEVTYNEFTANWLDIKYDHLKKQISSKHTASNIKKVSGEKIDKINKIIKN
jgi:hypothetical protein